MILSNPSIPTVMQGDLSSQLCNELSAYKELAVDCEMMGLNPRRDRLCVVQLAVENGATVVLQVNEAKGSPKLKKLMEDESITKLFHFARVDILFLFCRLNISVHNVYCTKLASHLARTYTDRHGLRELVREFVGKNLDKTCQSSDWGAQGLTSEQIKYAAGDVIHLFEIRRCLDLILKREKRYELLKKLIAFLPTQRELDCLGYHGIFEYQFTP